MSRKQASPLEAHLGYWMRFLSNHVSHAFKMKVEARGVTVAEWVVLRTLYDSEGAAPSAVADRLGLTRGAISKLADRLIAKSLLARSIDKDDRRYQTLALTSAGRALVPQLAALADQNDGEFFGHLPASQRRVMADLLKDIVRRRKLKDIPLD